MSKEKESTESDKTNDTVHENTEDKSQETDKDQERGGPSGPEPTRYGDWEIGGKCVDF